MGRIRRLELLDWVAADLPGLGRRVDLVWIKGAESPPTFLPSNFFAWGFVESDVGNLDDIMLVAGNFDPPVAGNFEVAGNLETLGSLDVAEEGNLEDDRSFSLIMITSTENVMLHTYCA